MITKFDPNDPESQSKILREMYPDVVCESIRKAILFGWFLLPKDQRTEENLEREIRRLVDEVIHEFREDKDAFLSLKVFFPKNWAEMGMPKLRGDAEMGTSLNPTQAD